MKTDLIPCLDIGYNYCLEYPGFWGRQINIQCLTGNLHIYWENLQVYSPSGKFIPGRHRDWRRKRHSPPYSCLRNPMDRGAWRGCSPRCRRVWPDWAQVCPCTHTHTHRGRLSWGCRDKEDKLDLGIQTSKGNQESSPWSSHLFWIRRRNTVNPLHSNLQVAHFQRCKHWMSNHVS